MKKDMIEQATQILKNDLSKTQKTKEVIEKMVQALNEYRIDDIGDFIENNLNIKNFVFKENKNFNDIKNYYENAKADSIYCYSKILDFLSKDKKILEVGGGIHLLTSFLNKEFNITSVEPG